MWWGGTPSDALLQDGDPSPVVWQRVSILISVFFFLIFIHLFLALLGLWLQCVGFLSWGLLLLQHKGLIVAPQQVGSYQTRDRTRVPCASRQVLHHRTTKDVLDFCFDFSVSLLTLGLEITVKLSKCNRFFFFLLVFL